MKHLNNNLNLNSNLTNLRYTNEPKRAVEISQIGKKD